MSHRRAVLVCVMAVLAWLTPGPTPALAESPPAQAQVIRVIDGDTIQVRIGHVTELVRYIGIDTPETVHPTRGPEPYGEAAKEVNRTLVEAQVVTLVFDVQERDRYFRLLAYVWVGDRLVNAELVKKGYASAAAFPPNVRHAEYFRQLERNAREWKQGLWADPATAGQVEPAVGNQEAEAARRAAPPQGGEASSSEVSALSGRVSSPSASGRAPAPSGSVKVQGHYRRDGSYVAPYSRRAPKGR
jgi:micrococcal nuclease